MTVVPHRQNIRPDPDHTTAIEPAQKAARLTLDIIDTEAGLQALQPQWQALERRDPDGTVFLSWTWLARAFHQNPGRWRVFVVRRAHFPDACVCVFPVKYRVHWSKTRREFQSEIEAGGRLIWSEYTGFLCDPEWEAAAIDLIAKHLRQMPWSRLSLRYEGTQRRARRFMAAFPEREYSVHWKDYRINQGETDNLACPQVALPGDYESYLSDCLSANTRQKLRRFTRQQIDTGKLHVTVTDAASFDRDVGVLLRLWTNKWARTKGPDTAAKVAANYRLILHNALQLDLLYLPVLWQGETPVGLLGHILDPQMKRVHFIVAGRDDTAPVPSIGLLLHAQAIRWAIERGYETYDFCHGDEAYKYNFGAQDKRVGYFSIRPRRHGAPGAGFDPLSSPDALRRVIGFIETGQDKDAVRASRQVLAVLQPTPAKAPLPIQPLSSGLG